MKCAYKCCFIYYISNGTFVYVHLIDSNSFGSFALLTQFVTVKRIRLCVRCFFFFLLSLSIGLHSVPFHIRAFIFLAIFLELFFSSLRTVCLQTPTRMRPLSLFPSLGKYFFFLFVVAFSFLFHCVWSLSVR